MLTAPSGGRKQASFGPLQTCHTRHISLFPPFSDSQPCHTHTPPFPDPQTGELFPHHYSDRETSAREVFPVLEAARAVA